MSAHSPSSHLHRNSKLAVVRSSSGDGDNRDSMQGSDTTLYKGLSPARTSSTNANRTLVNDKLYPRIPHVTKIPRLMFMLSGRALFGK